MNSSAGAANNQFQFATSFYNSPYFLIPTNTNNMQHRSAAYHDNSVRLMANWSNPFSLGGNVNSQNTQGAYVNDTWHLTYNPHPLLPSHNQTHQSSTLSSAGGMFRTRSDQEQTLGNHHPLLQRTTSQPFIMRSDQKPMIPQNHHLNQSH